MHGRIVMISRRDDEPEMPADYEIMSEYGGNGHFDYVLEIPEAEQDEERNAFAGFLQNLGQAVGDDRKSFTFSRKALFDSLFGSIPEDAGRDAVIGKALAVIEEQEYSYPVMDNGWGLDTSFVHHALQAMDDGETYKIGTIYDFHF